MSWGRAYVDDDGLGAVLPCSAAIHDETGRLLGVAGVELDLSRVAAMLSLPGEPTLASYLVGADGVIRVQAGEGAKELSGRLLPYARVRRAILAGRSGVVHLGEAEPPLLISHTRLDAVGWFYVVVAEAERILGAPPLPRPKD